ncbi:MAG: outer membrane protein assembly factor BamB [Verrucomicrobiales bacterium]|jgi:outer membrane protein assembly factor BamB
MKTTILTTILGASTLVSIAAVANAEDVGWPQWRGPLGNGVVPEGKPVVEWSENKNVKWKVEVPGSGTSTPIIVGDKIFLLTAASTGKKAESTPAPEASGEEITERPRGGGEGERPEGRGERPRGRADGAPQGDRGGAGQRRGAGSGFQGFGDGPLPDFAKPFDKDEDGKLSEKEQEAMRAQFRSRRGGRGGEGRRRGGGFGGGGKPTEVHQFSVVCLDRKSGKPIWSKVVKEALPHEGHHRDHGYASASPITDGKHLYAYFGSRGLYCLDMDGNVKWEKEFGQMQISNGFGEGTSPALHGDTLVIKWDHEGDSFIAALDKNTGDEKWRKSRDERTSWATPYIVEYDGVVQVIANASEKIASYDLKTGDLIWESTGMTRNVIPTPVAGDDIVYVTSGFRGSALQAIKLGSKGKVKDTDSIVWSHDEGTPYVPSPLLYEGRLYFFQANDARLSCLDAKSGKVHYSRETVEGLRGVYASPIGVGGKIYLVGRKGSVAVIKSSDKLEVLATNKLDDEFDAGAVVVADELFLRGKKHLYCLAAGG